MNRFKKLQRKKSTQDTSEDKVSSKGGRTSKQKKSSWTEVPTANEMESDVGELMKDIKKDWKQPKRNHGKIKEMMERTYAKRREMVLVDVQPLKDIVNSFPPLQNMLYVSILRILL
jgi:hypothetical protein